MSCYVVSPGGMRQNRDRALECGNEAADGVPIPEHILQISRRSVLLQHKCPNWRSLSSVLLYSLLRKINTEGRR